jgi:hypothetical protein
MREEGVAQIPYFKRIIDFDCIPAMLTEEKASGSE